MSTHRGSPAQVAVRSRRSSPHLAPDLQPLSRGTQSWLPRKGQPPRKPTAWEEVGVVHPSERGASAASTPNAYRLAIRTTELLRELHCVGCLQRGPPADQGRQMEYSFAVNNKTGHAQRFKAAHVQSRAHIAPPSLVELYNGHWPGMNVFMQSFLRYRAGKMLVAEILISACPCSCVGAHV